MENKASHGFWCIYFLLILVYMDFQNPVVLLLAVDIYKVEYMKSKYIYTIYRCIYSLIILTNTVKYSENRSVSSWDLVFNF